MPDLFEEVLTCSECPDVDEISEEIQKQEIESHLNLKHRRGNSRISTTAFVIAHRPEDKERIQSFYDEAAEYLDNNFASDFLYHFDQRCWELCTYKYLKENSVTINKNPQTAGPDFDTKIGYVECIAVTRGTGDDAIPFPQASILKADGTLSPEFSFNPVPTDAIKMRISSAFCKKREQYANYCKQRWFDQSKPRIIAINWFCDGASWESDGDGIEANPSLQTMFGTGFTELVIDTETGSVIDQRLSRKPVLTNMNNSSIHVGYFAKPPENDNKRIDGVVFSSSWPGTYHPETYRAVNNPFTNGLDLEKLSLGYKTIAKVDGNDIQVTTR